MQKNDIPMNDIICMLKTLFLQQMQTSPAWLLNVFPHIDLLIHLCELYSFSVQGQALTAGVLSVSTSAVMCLPLTGTGQIAFYIGLYAILYFMQNDPNFTRVLKKCISDLHTKLWTEHSKQKITFTLLSDIEYDESKKVKFIRKGGSIFVPFYNLKEDDTVALDEKMYNKNVESPTPEDESKTNIYHCIHRMFPSPPPFGPEDFESIFKIKRPQPSSSSPSSSSSSPAYGDDRDASMKEADDRPHAAGDPHAGSDLLYDEGDLALYKSIMHAIKRFMLHNTTKNWYLVRHTPEAAASGEMGVLRNPEVIIKGNRFYFYSKDYDKIMADKFDALKKRPIEDAAEKPAQKRQKKT